MNEQNQIQKNAVKRSPWMQWIGLLVLAAIFLFMQIAQG
jgi:uncharacterized membrane protein YjjP (DUF1212 family)